MPVADFMADPATGAILLAGADTVSQNRPLLLPELPATYRPSGVIARTSESVWPATGGTMTKLVPNAVTAPAASETAARTIQIFLSLIAFPPLRVTQLPGPLKRRLEREERGHTHPAA